MPLRQGFGQTSPSLPSCAKAHAYMHLHCLLTIHHSFTWNIYRNCVPNKEHLLSVFNVSNKNAIITGVQILCKVRVSVWLLSRQANYSFRLLYSKVRNGCR